MANGETTQHLRQQMQDWRHDIHRHPELAFEERRTADIVAGLLADWGIEVHREIGKTGVVGVLKRGESSRAIGLRARKYSMTGTNTMLNAIRPRWR